MSAPFLALLQIVWVASVGFHSPPLYTHPDPPQHQQFYFQPHPTFFSVPVACSFFPGSLPHLASPYKGEG